MPSLVYELWLTIGTERFWDISAGPTSPLWAVSFVHMMILGNNKWHMKGNSYTYRMAQSTYKPINPRAIAPQRQYSEILLLSLYSRVNIRK